MGAILKEAIRVPNLGGCVTSSSSCDSPRIAVPFGPVLRDVLSGHLTGSKVMRLTLDSRAPGFQVHNPVMVPAETCPSVSGT